MTSENASAKLPRSNETRAFAPAATRPFCRLAPVKDACLWWDFGEHRAVAVDEYTLVHGAATSWGALRAWSVLATNEMPPAFTAVDLEEDGAAAEEAVVGHVLHAAPVRYLPAAKEFKVTATLVDIERSRRTLGESFREEGVASPGV